MVLPRTASGWGVGSAAAPTLMVSKNRIDCNPALPGAESGFYQAPNIQNPEYNGQSIIVAI